MTMPTDKSATPFHPGELEVQERHGVRDKIDTYARRVIRTYMPDQHRIFYAQLPFVVLGALDEAGRPWASILAGQPGFMSTPDAQTLRIGARPIAGDPLEESLSAGSEVGILGIEQATRRRNRLSGRVAATGPSGFDIAISQTFGNCPQYIQARSVETVPDAGTRDAPVHRSSRFDTRAKEMIENADTLFVATSFQDGGDNWSNGADVSHRGGKPGFVKVEDDRTFVFPDFSGNNHFNTVGNIVRNPKAGFLFVDFSARDLLYMTGHADIVWEGDEVRAFAGAERLIRFTADTVLRIDAGLPLRFTFSDYSPLLDRTGDWQQAAEIAAAEQERNVYLPFEVVDRIEESEAITSFRLRRTDGKAPARYEPGQFLPIRLKVPGVAEPVSRTYTISDAPDGDHYRLSIKREGGDAVVSNHFHDRVHIGSTLEAMSPRGKFVLDRSSERPVVLISAGVGITPMVAMANFLIDEGERTRNFRKTYFIHGAASNRVQAFGAHLRALAEAHEAFHLHVRYSNPDVGDRLGVTHDSEGRIDMDLLKETLPFDDFDFYLCGPAAFMQSIHDGLTGLGVREERIHYESFGPSTVLKHDVPASAPSHQASPVDGPVKVRFAKTGLEAEWTPDKGTLLDLAEEAGLSPAFSCRSGVCGSCATRLQCGQVDYLEEPAAAHGDGEVLICCSTPRSATGPASCGPDGGVVLGL